MTERIDFDQVRSRALASIDRDERNYKLAFFGAVILEGLLLLAFLLLADLKNRTHLLILLATVGSYSIIALGLLALGAHINRHSQIILKAIETTAKRL